MRDLQKLLIFTKPYIKHISLSLGLLIIIIFFDLMIPRLIQRVVDEGVLAKNMDVVIQTSYWMFGISFLNTALVIGLNYFSVTAAEAVGRDIRGGLMQKIQQFSHADLDKFPTGMLITRVTSDISTLQRLLRVTLRIGTRAPLLLLGSIILMFLTNTRLALYIVPLYLLALAVIVYVSNRMEPFFNKVKDRLDRLNTVLQENIAGALVVKSFARSNAEDRRFAEANTQFTQYSIEVSRFIAAMPSGLTLIVNLGMVLVIWVGGFESYAGFLTIGQIMAFTNYLFVSLNPLLLATDLANVWANGIASAKRMNEVFDAVPAILPADTCVPLPKKPIEEVLFERVSFGYQADGDAYVLREVDITARKGETVAILGATGSGKSSLINLLPRFYDPNFGRVRIDGVDIRFTDPNELRARIAVVAQESILFSGTVRENIAFSDPNASEERIIAAAKMAQAHEFIAALPAGYNSRVEERGHNFSGGQKQRLSIARALLKDPDILIFDDATSAVDVETENAIQTALSLSLANKIVLVVAQRISTVLNADQILVLEHGRIAANGRHADLLRESQIYREIYDSQLGGAPNGVLNGFDDGK